MPVGNERQHVVGITAELSFELFVVPIKLTLIGDGLSRFLSVHGSVLDVSQSRLLSSCRLITQCNQSKVCCTDAESETSCRTKPTVA